MPLPLRAVWAECIDNFRKTNKNAFPQGNAFFVLLISFVRGKSFFFQLCVGCHQFFRADGIEGDLIKKVCTHFADGKHRSRSECKVTHSVACGKNISGMSLSDTGGYCGFFCKLVGNNYSACFFTELGAELRLGSRFFFLFVLLGDLAYKSRRHIILRAAVHKQFVCAENIKPVSCARYSNIGKTAFLFKLAGT